MFDTNKPLGTFITRTSPSYLGSSLNDLLHSLDRVSNGNQNYPPRNIRKIDEQHHIVEFALVGWSPEDISVWTEKGYLYVEGKSDNVEENDEEYLYRGISTRNFDIRFKLAERVEVMKAEMDNGLLRIFTEVIVPEEEKPKMIEIQKQ